MLARHIPTLLPHDVMRSLVDVFRPGEEILGSISSLAGSLVLTDRRVLILREGRGYRPQSGIRSWDIEPGIAFTYGPPRGGVGRLMIGKGKDATSFFVKTSRLGRRAPAHLHGQLARPSGSDDERSAPGVITARPGVATAGRSRRGRTMRPCISRSPSSSSMPART